MADPDRLRRANETRRAEGAKRAIRGATAVLNRAYVVPAHLAAAARLRVEHPNATLAELAELAGVTRNAYAARLRRAIRLAAR